MCSTVGSCPRMIVATARYISFIMVDVGAAANLKVLRCVHRGCRVLCSVEPPKRCVGSYHLFAWKRKRVSTAHQQTCVLDARKLKAESVFGLLAPTITPTAGGGA